MPGSKKVILLCDFDFPAPQVQNIGGKLFLLKNETHPTGWNVYRTNIEFGNSTPKELHKSSQDLFL